MIDCILFRFKTFYSYGDDPMLLTVYRATFTVTRGHVLTHSLPKENIRQIVALYAKQEYRGRILTGTTRFIDIPDLSVYQISSRK